jgi:hypothetical protein
VVTVRVAELLFPSASLADAVHTLIMSEHPDCGAVKTPFANRPPLVHVTTGVDVAPELSVADTVALPVSPAATVRVAGLKLTTGGIISSNRVGGGGGGADGGTTPTLPELPLEPPPPLQDIKASALNVIVVVLSKFVRNTIRTPLGLVIFLG